MTITLFFSPALWVDPWADLVTGDNIEYPCFLFVQRAAKSLASCN
jgi:hypothetical protein